MILEFKSFEVLTEVEHKKILSIRNLDYVRNNMKSKDIIEYSNHLKWIDKLKNDEKNFYYAVKVDGEIVGAVYITEIDGRNSSTWGLYFRNNINPMVSSYSAYLLIDRIFNFYSINELRLEVNKKNVPAYKFDLTLGFKLYDEVKDGSDELYKMHMTHDEWENNKNKSLMKVIGNKLKKVEHTFIDGGNNVS